MHHKRKRPWFGKAHKDERYAKAPKASDVRRMQRAIDSAMDPE